MATKTTKESLKRKFETIGSCEVETFFKKSRFPSQRFATIKYNIPKHGDLAEHDLHGIVLDGSVLNVRSLGASNHWPYKLVRRGPCGRKKLLQTEKSKLNYVKKV